MKSIALNARFYAHRPTGMQRYALELAQRFGQEIESVRPWTPLTGMAGHLWEQLYLPSAARGRLLWSPNNTGPVLVARQVCTFHDLIPLDNPEWFSPRFSAWYGWLIPRLAHKIDHIIAVSEFTKQRIVERTAIRPEKVTVIPNGRDARFSPRTPQEIARTLAALHLPSERYVLCVGSIEPRKNLRRLLQAWEQVLPRLDQDISLVIAGAKGDARVFSSAACDRLPARVYATGYISEAQLPALYSGALALVYPSLYEGFGLPPLEAMACGTPVITSNTTSLPEVVGQAALLVDPRQVEEIGAAIERVARDAWLRERLRREGLARASAFSWDRAASATLAILEAHA